MPCKYTYILLALLIMSSCFNEDEPLPPYEGNVTTVVDHIEYFQSYFDFESNKIVESFPADSWALGFSCNSNSSKIITNSGAGWFIHNTLDTGYIVSSPPSEKIIWQFDQQSYFPDSTAVGDIYEINNQDTSYSNHVYFLGKYIGGAYTQVYVVKFLHTDRQSFTIVIKDSSQLLEQDTLTINKKENKNFVYWHPEDQSTLDLEPEKTRYDLVFGPYYDIATQIGITAPYLVRGALLNISKTTAVLDTINSYYTNNAENISDFTFSQKRNTVGFEWKEVFIDQASGTASYKIRPNYSYLIKTGENNTYKFRFLTYKANGENGYPSFEFEQINP